MNFPKRGNKGGFNLSNKAIPVRLPVDTWLKFSQVVQELRIKDSSFSANKFFVQCAEKLIEDKDFLKETE